jgi:hypothetical protein
MAAAMMRESGACWTIQVRRKRNWLREWIMGGVLLTEFWYRTSFGERKRARGSLGVPVVGCQAVLHQELGLNPDITPFL